MAVRGLVFDLYGTLVTRGQGWRAYRELIFALPPWKWRSTRRAALTQAVPSIAEFHAQAGVRRGPGPAHYERLVEEGLAQVELFPETLEVLEQAREQGLALALLSNLAAPYKAPVFELGLAERFDTLVFSCDEGVAKPDPGVFSLTAARLGLAPEELVMVGDSVRDDIRGARGAGFARAVHIDRRPGKRAPKRDRIGHLSEVLTGLSR